MLKIYNTLTREKEIFRPLNPLQVNMYTCGVTVYDDCHVGHARSLYIFDAIRNYLQYRNFTVRFVRNITDIDDKIIKRAHELGIDWKDLVAKYIARYYEDLTSLGIKKADYEPRATENIGDMIVYIEKLIQKDYAYCAGGDVYFDVRKFSSYGKLSGQHIEQMRSGARIEPTEHKKDPLDFALWKSSKEGEPFWDSPWGPGRPGWHIECSVMSQKFLKTDTLDIHAGGRDLIFPHHENERAQAEAACAQSFAVYWIHHGLLTINGQKMAKSLGNFFTIKDVLKKYSPDTLKFLYLQAHYSHPVDFSWEKMEEAKKALDGFLIFFDRANRLAEKNAPPSAQVNDYPAYLSSQKEKFITAMDDDFNTPQALAVLFDVLRETNKDIHQHNGDVVCAKNLLRELGGILGLFKEEGRAIDSALRGYIEAKIEERNMAARAKDFSRADAIREELRLKGIILEDSKGWMLKPALEGTRWRLAS